MELNLQADRLILVDFGANWCGPCNKMHVVLNSLESKNPHVKIVKVDIEEEAELTAQYKISSIPTILFFKEGELIERLVGLQSETALQTMIVENS